MSLRSEPIPDVPKETIRVARAAFPKGNLYLKMRDELGTFYEDADFIDLFPKRGQPAFSPWRLALITVMQFAEGLSDRQAAEAVRARIDWKYALSLELENAGFDFSILSEFRARLLKSGKESVLLEKMLDRFREKGWIKAGGKQRTDSTHILANVRHLNRLESVCETLRAALNAVAKCAPKWLEANVSADWFKRYGRRVEEYRLPKGEKKRNDYAALVAADGFHLLYLIEQQDAPPELKKLKMVKLLRQMWEDQFEMNDGTPHFKLAKDLPPANERFDSPYDAEARYGNKRATVWRGYKAHFTETCDQDDPFLICNVETTQATVPDLLMSAAIHESLRKKELLPKTHLLDAGYIEAAWMFENAKAAEPIDIIGPLRANVQWQATANDGFALDDFSIDWENKQVICPEGQMTTNWYLRKYAGEEKVRVRFKRSQCNACFFKRLCTRSKDSRSLLFSQREKHEWLQEQRKIEETDKWQNLYGQRAGIEGTFSQAVRAFDFRRSRYIGERKTHLHNVATASAINIGRSINWLDGKTREQTRVSQFARLKVSEC